MHPLEAQTFVGQSCCPRVPATRLEWAFYDVNRPLLHTSTSCTPADSFTPAKCSQPSASRRLPCKSMCSGNLDFSLCAISSVHFWLERFDFASSSPPCSRFPDKTGRMETSSPPAQQHTWTTIIQMVCTLPTVPLGAC